MSNKKTGAANAAPDSATAEKELSVEQVLAQLEEVLQANAELLKEKEELIVQLEEAAELIEELKAAADKGAAREVTVEVDGITYLVTKGFKDRNRTWNPQDIAANAKLAAELVKKKSTILKPQNK